MRILSTFLFIVIFSSVSTAQWNQEVGTIPKVNIGYKLPNQMSLNFSAETRHILFESIYDQFQLFSFERAEFSGFFSYKIDLGIKASIGYHLLARNNSMGHRTIQQVSIVQNLNASRLGHRLALEENFNEGRISSVRSRYRIVWERALSGDRIDFREFYIKLGNEYLLLFDEGIDDLEIRLLPVLGYELNRRMKIEFGPDIRTSKWLSENRRIQVFTSLALYFS